MESKGMSKGGQFFWVVCFVAYAISVSLSYHRIYIAHDYPIYYTEDEIPDPLSMFSEVPSL